MLQKLRTPLMLAAGAALLAGSLSGCSGARETFGLGKSAPDEFAVVTRAPLSVPPDFRMRPPEPGAPRPQERTVQEEARGALLASAGRRDTGANPSGEISRGEEALLSRAGALGADPAIRTQLAQEYARLNVHDVDMLEWMAFWRARPEPGEVVDAEAESRRIRENLALGETVVRGQTPVIERRRRGLLEGIF